MTSQVRAKLDKEMKKTMTELRSKFSQAGHELFMLQRFIGQHVACSPNKTSLAISSNWFEPLAIPTMNRFKERPLDDQLLRNSKSLEAVRRVGQFFFSPYFSF